MASDRIEKLVATLADGTHIIEHADGRLEKRKTQTDWTRLAAMTEKTIEPAQGPTRITRRLMTPFLPKCSRWNFPANAG
jgi:hypothetical protein